MRLTRGSQVAGIDPQTARVVARCCHRGWVELDTIAAGSGLPLEQARAAVRALVDAGFLERRDGLDGVTPAEEWSTTLAGGALQQAKFLRPIARAKADQLLGGVLERAGAYEADRSKPLRIVELRLFGSYTDRTVLELGDLDFALVTEFRSPEWADADQLLAYAAASGRRFTSFIDELFWPTHELLMLLRARSSYINITTEDVSRVTARWEVVFPPPAGGSDRK